MIQLSRWKIILVVLALALGVWFALPNVLPANVRERMPGFMPSNTINLGLDLQGGSYLLLEVDTEALATERLNNMVEEIRLDFRRERIGFSGLTPEGHGVVVRLRDPAQTDAAVRVLNNMGEFVAQTGQRDRTVQRVGPGVIRVQLSEDALQAQASAAVEQSIEIVRRRIDSLGAKEPSITRQGRDRIVVQAAGESDPERLKNVIGQTARLTFQMVDEQNSLQAALAGQVPPDAMVVPTDEPGEPFLLLKRRVLVSGENLTRANVGVDQMQRPAIDFRFDGQGARRFGEVTAANVNRRFAIVLDGRVISAPTIISPITGGSGQITGNFSVQTASDLVNLLNAGALPAPLTVEEQRTVGAELGADAVRAGLISTVVAFVLVLAFMVLSYGFLFGGISVIALLANGLLIMAVMSVTGADLTLPGIAGLILTLAMAVDANVLIYERMRDEVRAGRPPILAMDAGFGRAMVTIIDANLTTLIAAWIMFFFGAGPVRGFAWTLTIGVVTSVFTAVLITQILLALWFRLRRPKALPIA
ncbi:protein translocase subunit SecD [Brevundimonas sp. 2R-24]|uniref:Protein translocase subunit SecD n=1 Tax=Peiella sedimenti TaxID=3061083 RepID=A0ABT8SKA6_9CAUL|nr:protein translocase subunit SecD [Caulobacteraceae bacterium XZ-24]